MWVLGMLSYYSPFKVLRRCPDFRKVQKKKTQQFLSSSKNDFCTVLKLYYYIDLLEFVFHVKPLPILTKNINFSKIHKTIFLEKLKYISDLEY